MLKDVQQDGKPKRGGGRPSEYKQHYASEARKLCQLGATDRDLADFFEVTTVTIWRWQSRYPAFCNAVRVGKQKADERVKRSLYQRAVGYSYDSEKVMQYEGQIVRAPIVEHCPPDMGAIKLWLTNRAPEEWREKTQNTVNAGTGFLDVLKALGKASKSRDE